MSSLNVSAPSGQDMVVAVVAMVVEAETIEGEEEEAAATKDSDPEEDSKTIR